MKRLFVALALVAASASRVNTQDDKRAGGSAEAMPASTVVWYDGPTGLEPDDIRFPEAVPDNIRQRFQAQDLHAKRTNSWIAWVTVFAASDSPGGRVAVCHLTTYWVVERDGRIEHIPACRQVWPKGDVVWGGWWDYTEDSWFQTRMTGKNDFPVIGWVAGPGEPENAVALIDTTRHPKAAGHIWQKTWPRLVAPVGTIGVQIICTMAIEGDALVHVGLDRYKSETEDDQPEQEVLVSDTYGEEHCRDGRLTVSLVTSRIKWLGQ